MYNFFTVSVASFHCLRCYIGLICHESSYDWCAFLCQFFCSWCPCAEGFNASYTVAFTCTCEGCFLSHWSFQSWTTRCLTICVLVLDGTSNLAIQFSWVCNWLFTLTKSNNKLLVLLIIVIEGLRSLELIVHYFVALVCQFFQTGCVVGCTDWLT